MDDILCTFILFSLPLFSRSFSPSPSWQTLGTSSFPPFLSSLDPSLPLLLDKLLVLHPFLPSSLLSILLSLSFLTNSWYFILSLFQTGEPYCSQAEDNCGNVVAAIIWFYTYYFFVTFILLNVLIGEWQTKGQTDLIRRQTGRQTGRQTDEQMNRQTDKQTDRTLDGETD